MFQHPAGVGPWDPRYAMAQMLATQMKGHLGVPGSNQVINSTLQLSVKLKDPRMPWADVLSEFSLTISEPNISLGKKSFSKGGS